MSEHHCARCFDVPMYVPTGELPDPSGDGTVDWCAECWAAVVGGDEHDPLNEIEAAVWAVTEHLDLESEEAVDTARTLTGGLTPRGVRAVRRRAHIKRNDVPMDLPEMPFKAMAMTPGK